MYAKNSLFEKQKNKRNLLFHKSCELCPTPALLTARGFAYHAHVDFRSSFRFSLRIFEQTSDCSQSTTISDRRDALLTYGRAKC